MGDLTNKSNKYVDRIDEKSPEIISFELALITAKTYGFTFAPKTYDKNIHLPDIKLKTTKFVAAFDLKFNDHLSNLSGVTYPYLSPDHLMIANLVAIILWLIDDFVDEDISTNVKTPLDKKLDLLNACKNVCSANVVGGIEAESLIPSSIVLPSDLLDNLKIVLPSNLPDNLKIVTLLQKMFEMFKNPSLRAFGKKQFAEYLDGVVQHLHLDPTKPLSLSEFFDVRRLDGGCEVVWPLCFLDDDDENFDLIKDLLESDLGLKLRFAANFNVAIVNDILSFDRDVKRGDNFNAVLSYMHEYSVNREYATKALVEMCNKYFDEIIRVSTKFESHTQEERLFNKIAGKLALWCQASLIWHIETERYKAAKESLNKPNA
jgi:hypothetical protein